MVGRGSPLSKLLGELNAVFRPASFPLSYPASDRHGCTPERVLRHRDVIGEPTAALGAAEAEILQRLITATSIHNRL